MGEEWSLHFYVFGFIFRPHTLVFLILHEYKPREKRTRVREVHFTPLLTRKVDVPCTQLTNQQM